MKTPKSIVLIGRRWFHRGPGNTYHSVEIIVDGKQIHKVPFAYGYGDQWKYTAFDWLNANGYLPEYDPRRDSHWGYCERNNIAFVTSCTDVQRKKDL